MQAQQTNIASLRPVGRSEGSDKGPGTVEPSELLFRLGVPEEPVSNISNAVTAVVFEELTTSKETTV